MTEREIFDFLDKNGNGRVTATELLVMARHRTLDSPLLYAMDSISLGAFAVCAAQAGISRGLPPVVSCAAGFTVCFGGILRDLLSGRTDGIAIGAEALRSRPARAPSFTSGCASSWCAACSSRSACAFFSAAGRLSGCASPPGTARTICSRPGGWWRDRPFPS